MNSKILLSVPLIAIALTACSTTPTNQNTPTVLEQHKNISAEPSTKHNLAKLIKQTDNCVIEFTGNFETGKATEHWIFKGDQLISAFSNVDAEVENKQTVFDPKDAENLKNFNSLKNNFKASNLEKCN
ncbi:putative signal peptide protein [Acinetobacter guillouiae MSP4-18]|jgi:hypothetical protein|uniref:hypothetical protein n=1 Tax=Acinetobacter guillouiae TaxID=106649 RepID=UPI0002CDF9FC|nr:hypothetical protein [Acinetobacter guillouiae]ENU60267.1 hypothetical protein F981_00742 [Acinetobacter guillouiae CIP 63.46]EPH37507.1 putative signal peptide protein [Acinetobacter guillouiae MSP4-18]KAB0629748.1 hypothetical protein F7P82_02880 [Acinetobacter guillouiae]